MSQGNIPNLFQTVSGEGIRLMSLNVTSCTLNLPSRKDKGKFKVRYLLCTLIWPPLFKNVTEFVTPSLSSSPESPPIHKKCRVTVRRCKVSGHKIWAKHIGRWKYGGEILFEIKFWLQPWRIGGWRTTSWKFSRIGVRIWFSKVTISDLSCRQCKAVGYSFKTKGLYQEIS